MEIDREGLSRIKELLKDHPRGMNVTEIAREIGMNRISVAKYLEMLVVSGHIDVKAFGPSKVYFLSNRLPISGMLSLSSDFIIILDKDLRIVNVNDKFIEFTKARRDDILYQRISTLSFPLDFEPPIMSNIVDALNGRESAIEAYHKHKGKDRFFNIKFIPLVFDDGQKGLTILFEDITDRKNAEYALYKTEEFLRLIQFALDNSADLASMVLPDGRFYYVNNTMCNSLGYTREELLQMNVLDLDIVFTQERWAKGWEMHKAEGFVGHVESAYRAKDGTIIPVDIVGRYLKYNDKEFICASARNIAERKSIEEELRKSHEELEQRVRDRTVELNEANKALRSEVLEKSMIEEALRKSEERYRSIIENVSDCIWEVDQDMVFTYMNPRSYAIIGYTRDEMLGKPLYEFMHKEDADRFISLIPAIMRNRNSFACYEYVYVHKDGHAVRVEVSGEPVFDAQGNFRGYRGISRDVTKRDPTAE